MSNSTFILPHHRPCSSPAHLVGNMNAQTQTTPPSLSPTSTSQPSTLDSPLPLPSHLQCGPSSLISSNFSRLTPPTSPTPPASPNLDSYSNISCPTPPRKFQHNLDRISSKNLIKPHPHLANQQQQQQQQHNKQIHHHHQKQHKPKPQQKQQQYHQQQHNYQHYHPQPHIHPQIYHQEQQQSDAQVPMFSPPPAPRIPEMRRKLYLYHEQVITTLAGKEHEYNRASVKAKSASNDSKAAAHELSIVLKTEAQLADQVRTLEINKLRKTFFPLRTSDDIARLRHRLSAVSEEVLAAKSRATQLRRNARDEQARVEALRGDVQLLKDSEKAREQILADADYLYQQQQQQQQQQFYGNCTNYWQYQQQHQNNQKQQQYMKATQRRMTPPLMKMNRGVASRSNSHLHSISSSATNSSTFTSSTISGADSYSFRPSPVKGMRLASDLPHAPQSGHHLNYHRTKKEKRLLHMEEYLDDGTIHDAMSEMYADRFASVAHSAQDSLSAQLEARRLLVKSQKLLQEVHRRLWDAYVSANNMSSVSDPMKDPNNEMNNGMDVAGSDMNYESANLKTKSTAHQQGTGRGTIRDSILVEYKWAVWQAREAGKRIERAIALADKLPVRNLVESWDKDNSFLDLSYILLDQNSSSNDTRVKVERAVYIVDSACENLQDSIDMQDDVIDILRERLIHSYASNSISSLTHTSQSSFSNLGHDRNNFHTSNLIELQQNDQEIERMEMDEVISDVVRMRSDLAHQHLHFPSSSTFNAGTT